MDAINSLGAQHGIWVCVLECMFHVHVFWSMANSDITRMLVQLQEKRDVVYVMAM